MPRFFCDTPLVSGVALELPPGAARHVQVLRLQPGDGITLFDGLPAGRAGDVATEGEYAATITHMGRSQVNVQIERFVPTAREAARTVTLAVGMPANERMDWLIEKACELGVSAIQPLVTERCVVRLKGERADKKLAHWRAVAIAACEQCGRNRLPVIHEVMDLRTWLPGASLAGSAAAGGQAVQTRTAGALKPGAADLLEPQGFVLSLQKGSLPFSALLSVGSLGAVGPLLFLSGPEGGLSATEEAEARAAGFLGLTLGPRVLRAETAALAVLAAIQLSAGARSENGAGPL